MAVLVDNERYTRFGEGFVGSRTSDGTLLLVPDTTTKDGVTTPPTPTVRDELIFIEPHTSEEPDQTTQLRRALNQAATPDERAAVAVAIVDTVFGPSGKWDSAPLPRSLIGRSGEITPRVIAVDTKGSAEVKHLARWNLTSTDLMPDGSARYVQIERQIPVNGGSRIRQENATIMIPKDGGEPIFTFRAGHSAQEKKPGTTVLDPSQSATASLGVMGVLNALAEVPVFGARTKNNASRSELISVGERRAKSEARSAHMVSRFGSAAGLINQRMIESNRGLR